jgi:hypothetical protein
MNINQKYQDNILNKNKVDPRDIAMVVFAILFIVAVTI